MWPLHRMQSKAMIKMTVWFSTRLESFVAGVPRHSAIGGPQGRGVFEMGPNSSCNNSPIGLLWCPVGVSGARGWWLIKVGRLTIKGGTNMSPNSREIHQRQQQKSRWFRKRHRQPGEPADRWLTLLPTFSLLGIIALAIYAFSLHNSWAVLGYGVVVAVSSTLAGGLVGVLFGIPRSVEGSQNQKPTDGYVGNTNLEQVSDWLTKILVGVGLVQLGHAPDALKHLANSMKSGFGASSSSASFGLALSLTFAIGGFLYFYLWSRIFLFIDLPRSKSSSSETADSSKAVAPAARAARSQRRS